MVKWGSDGQCNQHLYEKTSHWCGALLLHFFVFPTMVYQFQSMNTIADIGEVDRDRGKFIINTCDADIVLCGNICSCDFNLGRSVF